MKIEKPNSKDISSGVVQVAGATLGFMLPNGIANAVAKVDNEAIITDDQKKTKMFVNAGLVVAGIVLSLAVKGGGCSGFQYEWGTTSEPPTIENLWLDPMAEMFVFGCTVDYVEELGGSYLKVLNPNAKAQCGCGESFGV